MMNNEVISNLLGSSTAGIIARFVCHPIDTLKSRVQTSTNPIMHIIKQTFREEGWAAWFKGIGPVVIGGVPGVCLYLTSYEYVKNKLSKEMKINPFLTYMISALTAETFCCLIFVPVDVMKERMQINRVKHIAYQNSFQAAKYILNTEGLRGFYKGYGATLSSYGPFACLYFTLYENFKESSKTFLPRGSTEIPFFYALTTSALAGAIASAVTSPLDMIKLRLQVHTGHSEDSSYRYTGMVDGLRRTFQQEGVRGLFRGAGTRVLFHTPSTAITMALFEACKRWWLAILHTRE